MSSETRRTKKPINQNLTIPNALSVFRILLVPLLAVFLLRNDLIQAIVTLGLSGLSDVLDGMIARRFNQVTELGKMLDPLADKMTQATIAICAAVTFPVLRLFLALLVVKEVLMLCGGVFLLKKGKRPCAAKWFGKLSTTLFYFSIGLVILMECLQVSEEVFQAVSLSALGITAVFMIYSFIRYFLLFLEILRSNDSVHKIDLSAEIRAKKSRE